VDDINGGDGISDENDSIYIDPSYRSYYSSSPSLLPQLAVAKCLKPLDITILDAGFEVPPCAVIVAGDFSFYFDILDVENEEVRKIAAIDICHEIGAEVEDKAREACMHEVENRLREAKFFRGSGECRFAKWRRQRTWERERERKKEETHGKISRGNEDEDEFGDGIGTYVENNTNNNNSFGATRKICKMIYTGKDGEEKGRGNLCEYKDLYFHNRRFIEVIDNDDDGHNSHNNNVNDPLLSSQKDGMKFLPQKMKRSEFELLASQSTIREINNPHAIINRHQPNSHGHIIQDSVVPLFWALHLFNSSSLPPSNLHIILYDSFEDVVFVSKHLTRPFNNSQGPMPHDGWFNAVASDKHIIYKDELEELVCPPQDFCRFASLKVGYDRMNLLGPHITYTSDEDGREERIRIAMNEDSDVILDRLEERGRVLNLFRDFGVANLLAADDSSGDDALDDIESNRMVITIIQRRSSRRIVNLPEVLHEVQLAVPNATVQVAEIEKLSIREQVQLVRSSTVLMAVEGGAMDIFNFARKNTVVIAWGRQPNLEMPEGGLVNDHHHFSVEFFHEVTFLSWTEGLNFKVFPVRISPGDNYTVSVGPTIAALKDGMEETKIESLIQQIVKKTKTAEKRDDSAGKRSKWVQKMVWSICLNVMERNSCSVGFIRDVTDRITRTFRPRQLPPSPSPSPSPSPQLQSQSRSQSQPQPQERRFTAIGVEGEAIHFDIFIKGDGNDDVDLLLQFKGLCRAHEINFTNCMYLFQSMVLNQLSPAPSQQVLAIMNDNEKRTRTEAHCMLSLFHGLYEEDCLKLLNIDSQRNDICVQSVYITGSMGSGTMYSSRLLDGVWQNHSRTESNVLVSWFSRSDVFKLLGGEGSGPTKFMNLYWDDQEVYADHMNYLNQCFYRKVILQVRHPLKVIASGLFSFQQEVGWFSYEKWDRLICISERIVNGEGSGIGGVCDANLKIDSRKTGITDYESLGKLEGGGEEERRKHIVYIADRWVRWNEYALMVVEDVVRLEDGAGAICQAVGMPCGGSRIGKEPEKVNSHSGNKREISWDELEKADASVFHRVRHLAKKLGYHD